MTSEYIKSTIELPKELTPVWVRVCGRRPMKMYRNGNRFLYCNKTLHKNGNYASVSERVLWKYCKNKEN